MVGLNAEFGVILCWHSELCLQLFLLSLPCPPVCFSFSPFFSSFPFFPFLSPPFTTLPYRSSLVPCSLAQGIVSHPIDMTTDSQHCWRRFNRERLRTIVFQPDVGHATLITTLIRWKRWTSEVKASLGYIVSLRLARTK